MSTMSPQALISGKWDEPGKRVLGQLRAILINSWINVLLVFVPAEIASYYGGVSP